jgi:hypothetical protein
MGIWQHIKPHMEGQRDHRRRAAPTLPSGPQTPDVSLADRLVQRQQREHDRTQELGQWKAHMTEMRQWVEHRRNPVPTRTEPSRETPPQSPTLAALAETLRAHAEQLRHAVREPERQEPSAGRER